MKGCECRHQARCVPADAVVVVDADVTTIEDDVHPRACASDARNSEMMTGDGRPAYRGCSVVNLCAQRALARERSRRLSVQVKDYYMG
jgi:hypothetical protein